MKEMKEKVNLTILLVCFYLISNAQSYSNQIVLSDEVNKAKFVLSSDVDNDGDSDIWALGNDNVILFENMGDGSFSDGMQILELDLPKSLITEDIDNDGDLDLIIGGGWSDDYIVWYTNNGNGSFNNPQIIATDVNNIGEVVSFDVDGDDIIDVVCTGYHGDELVWFKNNGSGSFSSKNIIASNLDGADNIFVGDFNSNSIKDIVITTYNDKEILIFTNMGNGTFTKKIINTIDGYLNYITGSDINNDGMLDIVSNSSNGRIAWYKNEGDNTFTENFIGYESNIGSVSCSDLNNDGNIDVSVAIYTLSGKISVYMNNGMGNFSDIVDISTDVEKAICIYTSDIDNDGDIDILSASERDNKIALYKNELISGTIMSSDNTKFKLQSNPIANFLKIEVSTNLFRKLQVFDVIGNLKYESKDIEDYHNLSHLANGTYLLKLSNKNTIQTKIFLKQ